MTTLTGLLGGDQQKFIAWTRCQILQGHDPASWRIDEEGNAIRYADYGDRTSDYGWEIDHRVANALGGGDHPANTRALHWKANASHGGLLANALQSMSTNRLMTGK